MQGADQTGRVEDDCWHIRKDGTRFFCNVVVTALPNGGPNGYAMIGRDITGKKRAEAEQENRLEQNQRNIRMRDEFFAMMSHELKHPLNLIQLNAELVARLSVVKTQAVAARAVETILNAVSSQARIIDDLLDLSRINTGKLKLNIGPVIVQNILEEITSVLSAEAWEKDISIEVDLPAAACDPLVAEADPVRVEQILWNLLNNAVKFTPDGGAIHVSLGQEGEMLKVTVRDDGQGIGAESLPKIFDLFGQAPEGHRAPRKPGLGIGLALVRELIEAQGGRIEAQSPGLGQGSTFTVWLPAYQSFVDADFIEQPAGGQFTGVRVLLVDDSDDIREVMQALLELEGALVDTAGDGEGALALLDGNRYDLILSDISMPGMDGHELMRRIRQLGGWEKTPAIALTGFGAATDVDLAYKAGFNAHVSKPVSLETLQRTAMELGALNG